MNMEKLLAELRAERENIDNAIRALEGLQLVQAPAAIRKERVPIRNAPRIV
jgi:hypothetical protein